MKIPPLTVQLEAKLISPSLYVLFIDARERNSQPGIGREESHAKKEAYEMCGKSIFLELSADHIVSS